MPTYEYRCERCGATSEVVQSFADAPLTTCESCGGPLRKVYAPVGIVFKGSGFYKTDSRSSSKRAATPKGDGATSTADATSEAKPDAKPDSRPDGAATKTDGAPARTDGTAKPAAAAAAPKPASGSGGSAP